MKKFKITLPIFLIILATLHSCMKGDFKDEETPETNDFIENLTIAESFDWSMTKTLNISVTLPDADLNRALRIYTQDETELLYIGYSNNGSNIINSQITIPTYLEIVKVFYGFEDFYVPFEIGIDESLNYNFDEGLTTKSLKDSDDDYDDCCKGGLRSLTMRYDGDNQETIQIYKKKDKKERIFLGTNINPGESFTITGDNNDKLAKDLYFYVGNSNKENIKLKTDCKTKLYVGEKYGDFTIMAGISENDLALCSKDDECGCDGGLAYMKLRYIGSNEATVQVKEKKGYKVIYSKLVQPNEEFSYTGTKKDGRLDNTLYLYVNGSVNASMHVSCSDPIAIGDEYGDFKIAAAYNGRNLTLCGSIDPVPDPDPDPDPGTGGGSTTTLSLDGTLAFEDLWPSKGDYDFNDLVIDYDFAVTKNENDEVLSITSVFIIHAFGASFHNGFGFQLPNVLPENIIEVSGYEVEGGGIYSIGSKGLENGQSAATVIVSDDSFNRMTYPGVGIGINTTENAPFVTPDTIIVQMVFYQDGTFGTSGAAITYNALDIGNFNPFIIINQNRSREVHLADFPPTDLADTDVFGTFNDNSIPANNRYYKSDLGLPWAINIPVVFDYPFEKKEVVRAYLKFAEWAESGGQLYPDWYLNEVGYRDDSLIY